MLLQQSSSICSQAGLFYLSLSICIWYASFTRSNCIRSTSTFSGPLLPSVFLYQGFAFIIASVAARGGVAHPLQASYVTAPHCDTVLALTQKSWVSPLPTRLRPYCHSVSPEISARSWFSTSRCSPCSRPTVSGAPIFSFTHAFTSWFMIGLSFWDLACGVPTEERITATCVPRSLFSKPVSARPSLSSL